MNIVTLGIDLGKNLNSIVGLDAEGQVVLRRRVRRATLAKLARIAWASLRRGISFERGWGQAVAA